MNNFRLIFKLSGCDNVSYYNKGAVNFRDSPRIYGGIISWIFAEAKKFDIKYIWYFFEPDLEITWLGENGEKFIEHCVEFLNQKGIQDIKVLTPKDGAFSEWFCNNEEEREFGAKRYSICKDYCLLWKEYEKDINQEAGGKGIKEQIKRTIHGICNPMGLNYLDEAYICFSRGLICLLFKLFSFKKAVWIYKNIFRQKY